MTFGFGAVAPGRRVTGVAPIAAAPQRHRAPDPGLAPPQTSSTARRPLPAAVRARMETAFGVDFSGVSVRADGAAAAMGAAAFTRGETISLHPGLYDRYDLHSPEGLEVIAHELAHVLQQRAGRVSGTGVTEDPALEAEADRAARRAVRGEPAGSGVDAPSGDIASVASAGAAGPQTGVVQPMNGDKVRRMAQALQTQQSNAAPRAGAVRLPGLVQAVPQVPVQPLPGTQTNPGQGQYANIPVGQPQVPVQPPATGPMPPWTLEQIQWARGKLGSQWARDAAKRPPPKARPKSPPPSSTASPRPLRSPF
jgi:Domain of unknown function (DUF4157)